MKVPMGPPPPREPKNVPQSYLPPSTIDSAPSKDISTAHAQTAQVVNGSVHPTSRGGTGNSDSEDSESPATEIKEISTTIQIGSHPYQIPAWSEPPGQPYYLEVLKDGAIIDTLNVSEKGAYMFGRSHQCDFILEHPTISRYHAVLQYKGNGDVFIYDLGSTHGTVVNKIQVTPNIYKQLHVGDIFRFGTSSRLYILQGPTELMPLEKPAGVRQRSSEMNCLNEMADMEASLLRARREASLAEGISWGMMEDAVDDDIEVVEEEVTWQTYKGQLTEKQEKTRDKIIKRNEKVANLKKEIDAIQAKEIAQGGLTQGQQTQIARNEQRIEQILEELESLEETLNQSIQESIGARTGKTDYAKKKPTDEDEYEGQSDDDEFYDRTKKGSRERNEEKQQMVETAETLLEKKEKLAKEIEDTRVALQAEESTNQKQNSEGNLESDDPLDAFMTGVSSQIVKDRATRFQHKLESLVSEMERVVYLLKIADPTGEASLKRESQLCSLKTGQSLSVSVGKPINRSASSNQKNPTILQKKYDVGKINSEEKISLSSAVVDVKVPEHDKDPTVGIVNETSAVMKPRWLGAVHNPEDKVQNQEDFIHPENVSDSSEFVAYKDRRKAQITSNKEDKISASILEDAEGLVLRKPKEMGQKSNPRKENKEDEKIQCGLPSTTGMDAETSAADAVALLLRHKRGFTASDEEDHNEESELSSSIAHEAQKKKSKKLGPEKPGFLTQHATDYDAWVPPQVMDFECSDPGAWREALSSYGKNMESLNNPKLAELDKLYRTELPPSLHSRTPTAHITKNELRKVMEWKLSRGKWRPRLLSFVSSLDETSVKTASQKAFAALPDLKEAVNALSTLKGVGPATASAVLAAFDPQIAPFMSDEAMVAALGSSKEYTLKQYLIFAEKLQNKAKELNSKAGHVKEGNNGFFTASDIERALWSAAMGAKNVVDIPDGKGRANLKESDGQRKRRKS